MTMSIVHRSTHQLTGSI